MDNIEEILNDSTEKAFENFGYTEKIKTDSGVSIWLQIPFLPCPVIIDSQPKWVRTIDIFYIYSEYALNKANWSKAGLDVSKMPRGLGAPIYAAMEKICRKHGYALRIACVIEDRLRKSLIEKHGFKLQGHSSSPGQFVGSENSVIKVFDPICIVK